MSDGINGYKFNESSEFRQWIRYGICTLDKFKCEKGDCGNCKRAKKYVTYIIRGEKNARGKVRKPN